MFNRECDNILFCLVLTYFINALFLVISKWFPELDNNCCSCSYISYLNIRSEFDRSQKSEIDEEYKQRK